MTQRNVHGGHEFHFEDNLLIARSWGAWNNEAIILYGNEWRTEVEKKGFKFWGYCIDVREWELGTPSSIEHISTLIEWCAQRGAVFSGLLDNNVVSTHVIMEEHKRTVDEGDYRTFTNEQECLN